jgi:hypothetical protein
MSFSSIFMFLCILTSISRKEDIEMSKWNSQVDAPLSGRFWTPTSSSSGIIVFMSFMVVFSCFRGSLALSQGEIEAVNAMRRAWPVVFEAFANYSSESACQWPKSYRSSPFVCSADDHITKLCVG